MEARARIKRSVWVTDRNSGGGRTRLYGFGYEGLTHVLGWRVKSERPVRDSVVAGDLDPTNLVEVVAARRLGLPWLGERGQAQAWVRGLRGSPALRLRTVELMGPEERPGEVWGLGFADVAAATGLRIPRVHRHATSNGYVLRESGELLTMFDVSKFTSRTHGWLYVHRAIVSAGAKPMVDDAPDLARPVGRPSASESKRRKSRKETAERDRLIEVHRERTREWLAHWLPKISEPAPPKLVWTLPDVVQYVETQLREGLERGTRPHGPESEKPLRVILGAE
jgi:hypothetical protein